MRDLNVQEIKVLDYISQGLTSEEMASKMHLSERTIEGYRRDLLKKLGANNSAHMVAVAIQNELVEGLPTSYILKTSQQYSETSTAIGIIHDRKDVKRIRALLTAYFGNCEYHGWKRLVNVYVEPVEEPEDNKPYMTWARIHVDYQDNGELCEENHLITFDKLYLV